MKNLYAKLLKVQAEIKPIEKDSQNPHFKNFYFDISGLLAAVKPILTKNGIVLVQPVMVDELGQKLTTILTDVDSGEMMVSEMRLPELTDPQKLGAVISYYRRYALTSLLALEGEDTDANDTASQVKTQSASVKQATAPTTAAGAKCSSCGANMVNNPKTGKDFCEKKCWLAPQVNPPVETETVPF